MAAETTIHPAVNGTRPLSAQSNGGDKLMLDGDENPASSPLSVSEETKELNGSSPASLHPSANNAAAAGKSQTPPPQASDTTPRQTNGRVEHSSVVQPPKIRVKASRMSYQGIDLTAEAGETSTSISWHVPHPIFVIILVGPEELPFGIQKDLLCAQSPYYREEFGRSNQQIEYIVKLPDTDIDTFGCFQNFIYTGAVYDKARVSIPDYPLLMGVWKLATKLKMAPLRISVLDVMNERRQQTSCIPGTPLLVQAWKETEEGSGLRTMLISWAAEHMRTSPEIRNAFAKSLPQEILSELVIVMSELPAPASHSPLNYTTQAPQNFSNPVEIDMGPGPVALPARPSNPNKRPRKSETGFSVVDEAYEVKPTIKKVARRSEPGSIHRRKSKGQGTSAENAIPMTADREMNFCRDLIFRMLSGPGYWTRLVGPFRNPVDPVADNVPNYFAVVKRPMDLLTIRDKMARGEYNTAEEFEADVRLIFQNCYEYWTENDQIFNTCASFEKYFNEKWSARHKWVAPTIKSEIID